jgi:hypothetical protein
MWNTKYGASLMYEKSPSVAYHKRRAPDTINLPLIITVPFIQLILGNIHTNCNETLRDALEATTGQVFVMEDLSWLKVKASLVFFIPYDWEILRHFASKDYGNVTTREAQQV